LALSPAGLGVNVNFWRTPRTLKKIEKIQHKNWTYKSQHPYNQVVYRKTRQFKKGTERYVQKQVGNVRTTGEKRVYRQRRKEFSREEKSVIRKGSVHSPPCEIGPVMRDDWAFFVGLQGKYIEPLARHLQTSFDVLLKKHRSLTL